MRIYVPFTVPLLRRAVADRRVDPLSGIVFGVTDALRSEYAGADEEDLEYLAMADAARASLRLLAAGDGPWLRVVVAADVQAATPAPDKDRAVAVVDGPIEWKRVAAVHLDSADAAEAVRAAAAAVDAADLGDVEAEFAVGTVEDIDLGWYAPSEIAYLVDGLT